MSVKIANISIDCSKSGYVIIKNEDWNIILDILTEMGAEVDHHSENGIMDYFRNICKNY